MCHSSHQHFSLGVSAYKELRLQPALEHFTKAIELGADNIQVLDSRAAIFVKLHRSKEALQDAKRCIAQYPNAFQGYFRAAQVFANIGRFESARIMITKALEKILPKDSKHRDRLLQLESQISADESRARNKMSLKQCHSQKLPTEMLIEVFRYVFELNDHGTGHLPVAWVCREWKNIIDKHPPFWSCLNLTQRKPREKTKLWRDRSLGRIIDLRLGIYMSLRLVQGCLDILGTSTLPTLSRLRVPDNIIEELSSRKHILYSPLKLAEISIASRGGAEMGKQLLDSLVTLNDGRISQSLTRLSVPHCTMLPYRLVTAPMGGLRELNMQQLANPASAQEFRSILEGQSSLETLEIAIRIGGRIGESTINAPKLQKLGLRVSFDSSAPDTIGSVSAPMLRSFALWQPGRDCEIWFDTFTDYATVDTLRLQHCLFKPERLSDIIMTMSTLTTLEISAPTQDSHMNKSGRVIDAMSEQPFQLPNLQSVDFSNTPGLKAEPCVRLIQSRLKAAPKQISEIGPTLISSMWLNGCPDLDPELTRWMESKIPTFSATLKKEKRRR